MDNNLDAPGVSRRSVLKRAGWGGVALGVGAIGGLPLVSACGTSSGGRSSAQEAGASGAGDTASFSVQLGWIPNAEYSGFILAREKGYYAKAGLTVTILPGGPNVTPEPIVSTGKALLAVEPVPENVANAVQHGADLKIVGAEFQRSPECWVSLAKAPIATPNDIAGKRLGITLAGKNTALAFLKKNGVDPSKVKLVPISYDPAPLVAGEIDALWGLATNQPVQLAAQKVKTHTMLLADYGFNRMQDVLLTTGATLKDDKKVAALKKFIAASQQGWREALADPTGAATIVQTKYGKSLGLTVPASVGEINAMKPFIRPDSSQALLTMSQTDISQTISALENIVGVKADPSLFSNALF